MFESTDDEGGTRANQFGINIMERVLGEGINLENIATADWNDMVSKLTQGGEIDNDDLNAILRTSKASGGLSGSAGDGKYSELDKRHVESALTISSSLQRMHTDAAEVSELAYKTSRGLGATKTEAHAIGLQQEATEYLKNLLIYAASADANFFSKVYVDDSGEVGVDVF